MRNSLDSFTNVKKTKLDFRNLQVPALMATAAAVPVAAHVGPDQRLAPCVRRTSLVPPSSNHPRYAEGDRPTFDWTFADGKLLTNRSGCANVDDAWR